MPPHSNAESQHQEQQAEQRVNNWQQQQQMQQQQQHMYQPTGMERTAPTISPQPRAAFGVPAATFERDAVVGLPISAVCRPIAPCNQQPSHTSQWPLQARYSDSEIQSGQPRENYPLSPRRAHNPNVAPPNIQSAYNTPQLPPEEQVAPSPASPPPQSNQDEQARSISSGLQSIPPDPNLECVLCGKVFKIGQIQSFKRHSDTCTGSQK